MALFSKLIKCGHCGGSFKVKKERGKIKYICSKYDNYRNCKRISVEENFILDLIETRYDKKITEKEIRGIIDYIEIFDKIKNKEGEDLHILNIYFKNDKPIILSENFLQL